MAIMDPNVSDKYFKKIIEWVNLADQLLYKHDKRFEEFNDLDRIVKNMKEDVEKLSEKIKSLENRIENIENKINELFEKLSRVSFSKKENEISENEESEQNVNINNKENQEERKNNIRKPQHPKRGDRNQ
ncbi:MAG: hypothetical protein QXF12_02390 [Candidatus Aenigmatarchaeota archaeon]